MESKYFYLGGIIFFISNCVFCQNIRNSNWVFALNASQTPGVEGTNMKFGENGIEFDTFVTSELITYSNASISDKEGNLLFYSNGCRIYDSSFEMIENGDSLSYGGRIIDNNCPYWGNISRRDNIILPVNDSIYYLIHKRDSLTQFPIDIYNYELLYTEIKVRDTIISIVSKNNIFEDKIKFGYGYMHATQSEDLESWYISLVSTSGDSIYSYSIIDGKFDLADRYYFNGDIRSASGQSFFSPDGKLYAAYCDEGGLSVFDFDVSTGKYSNYRNVTVPDTFGFKGFCISPSSRFGYITTNSEIYQVDLWEENLENGVELIDTFDGFGDHLETRFGYGQLGPDCKIYITSTNSSKFMHVIHQPNLKGKACQFRQHDLELPHDIAPCPPNLPFYRDDPDLDCGDVLDVEDIIPDEEEKLTIYPNPTSGIFALDLGSHVGTYIAEVYDGRGKMMISKENVRTIDLSEYSNGIYFILISTNQNTYTEKILKID